MSLAFTSTRTPSTLRTKRPSEPPSLRGPAVVFGVVAAMVADGLVARRRWAKNRALWVLGGYVLFLSALLVGVMQRVQGMTIPDAVMMTGQILSLGTVGILIAPFMALRLVSENGLRAVFGMLTTGVASVGPMLILVWVVAWERWAPPGSSGGSIDRSCAP